MTRIDLTPLYRTSIGFDHLASLLNETFGSEQSTGGYPPYNVEAIDENHYSITLAIAGFKDNEIDIQIENGVLTVRGKKTAEDSKRSYLFTLVYVYVRLTQ